MAEPVSLKDVPGVGPATASKLREMDITTIEALAVAPVGEITDKTDIGFEKALQIICEARKLVGKATANPINQPTKNLKTKPSANPVFTTVIVKVIVVSKAKVIKNASNNSEYLLPNFIKSTRSKRLSKITNRGVHNLNLTSLQGWNKMYLSRRGSKVSVPKLCISEMTVQPEAE